MATAVKKKRKMSAEARKRISEGMKRRYAALHQAAAKGVSLDIDDEPVAKSKHKEPKHHEKLVLFVSGGVFKLCSLSNGNGEIKVNNIDFELVTLDPRA